MTLPAPSRAEQLVSLAATLRRVRWFCVAFAGLQFLIYDGPPGVELPHPVRPWCAAVVAWLLLTNHVAARFNRTDDVRRLERVAAAEVAADAALVLFLVALLSFDPIGAEWGLLNIVVLEAALRLNLTGAIACWASTAAPYLVIEVWATERYGLASRWNVTTFRMGVVLTVALVGGGLAQQLERHLRSARLARADADERARLLRIAAESGRSMAMLGTGEVLDSAVAAALEMGFDAVDVCALDEVEGVWRLERAANMPEDYAARGQAVDAGVSAVVRREDRTVVIEDYASWDGALADVREAGFATVIGVPVRVGGSVVATFGVGSHEHRPPTAAQLECLELLAAQLSAAFDVAVRESEARGLHELLAHSVSHDRLTGLPNREQLLARLDELADDDERAVVVCDVDGFRTVNDSLGPQAGDILLRAVAERITKTANGRMVARLAGDEFGIVIERGGVEAATRLARMLLLDFEGPLDVEGHRLVASLSIGAAAGTTGAPRDGAALLRDAGLAMERAKLGGRGRFELFDQGLRRRAQERLAIETDLRDAVDGGAIGVAYQPIVSLETGAVIGVEALARWSDPARGAVPPSEFIPLAEETGLIHGLGRRVLESACAQARAWQALAGPAPVRVSVNVSAVQLASPGFADVVDSVLRASGLGASCLVLDITERVVMDDAPEILRAVHELSELGVRLAVDDLGRGWSSLAYLTRYPLAELKIDRAFVAGVVDRVSDRSIVRALVGLAHDLGLTVVAEGIEEADQLAALARLGCDAGQGFHLHRPQSAADITELVAAGTSLRVG